MEHREQQEHNHHNDPQHDERTHSWLSELWRRTRPQPQRGILTMEPNGRITRAERVCFDTSDNC
jgi:hypothetical protein